MENGNQVGNRLTLLPGKSSLKRRVFWQSVTVSHAYLKFSQMAFTYFGDGVVEMNRQPFKTIHFIARCSKSFQVLVLIHSVSLYSIAFFVLYVFMAAMTVAMALFVLF